LRASGNDVYSPTLTGLGERAHLASRDVGLETHVLDVLGVLQTEDLGAVVLVGHSYGGIVVTAVADRVAQTIAHLVYLDAVVPRDGECLYDRAPAQIRALFEEEARIGGGGWQVPVAVATAQFLGLKRDEDVRWVLPKLSPQPIRTLRESVQLRSKAPPIGRTYINCIGDKPLGQPRTVQAEGIDDYHELQTGHDAMVTEPQRVAELLLEAAKSER
jgi:pimeloyl-ACP methyl ester carboxylesterase